jgi:hypothetical protein
MSISGRTRKILWVTAGGRCSICRVQIVTEGAETDDPAVFGEEAHIIAQSGRGPRAGQVDDADAYDNLILLCSKDHKRVDDQVAHYTVWRLKRIKAAHEQWIRSFASTSDEPDFSYSSSPNVRRLRRRAEEIRRERPERLHLRYLDHWREGVTTAAVMTWLDGYGREHERVVTDEEQALKLLGMIEDDTTLRVVSCDLS